MSIHALRMGGSYVQGGMGKSDITFPIMAMCQKEITARGSFRYGPGDYKLAIQLVANGSVDVKKLITGIVSFKNAEDAFKMVKAGRAIKILIAGPNEHIDGDGEMNVHLNGQIHKGANGNANGTCC
jgi:D-xylulose reductase